MSERIELYLIIKSYYRYFPGQSFLRYHTLDSTLSQKYSVFRGKIFAKTNEGTPWALELEKCIIRKGLN